MGETFLGVSFTGRWHVPYCAFLQFRIPLLQLWENVKHLLGKLFEFLFSDVLIAKKKRLIDTA